MVSALNYSSAAAKINEDDRLEHIWKRSSCGNKSKHNHQSQINFKRFGKF